MIFCISRENPYLPDNFSFYIVFSPLLIFKNEHVLILMMTIFTIIENSKNIPQCSIYMELPQILGIKIKQLNQTYLDPVLLNKNRNYSCAEISNNVFSTSVIQLRLKK